MGKFQPMGAYCVQRLQNTTCLHTVCVVSSSVVQFVSNQQRQLRVFSQNFHWRLLASGKLVYMLLELDALVRITWMRLLSRRLTVDILAKKQTNPCWLPLLFWVKVDCQALRTLGWHHLGSVKTCCVFSSVLLYFYVAVLGQNSQIFLFFPAWNSGMVLCLRKCHRSLHRDRGES